MEPECSLPRPHQPSHLWWDFSKFLPPTGFPIKMSYASLSFHVLLSSFLLISFLFVFLQALQPSVGLGLLYGFVTVHFSGVKSLTPCPNPTLEGQGLHFVWPLSLSCLAWLALPGVYAPASIALLGTGAHKSPWERCHLSSNLIFDEKLA
jgi:hypothetical protein